MLHKSKRWLWKNFGKLAASDSDFDARNPASSIQDNRVWKVKELWKLHRFKEQQRRGFIDVPLALKMSIEASMEEIVLAEEEKPEFEFQNYGHYWKFLLLRNSEAISSKSIVFKPFHNLKTVD